jgi:hypothetical protein
MKQIILALFSVFVLGFSVFAQAETCPKIKVTGGGVVQPGAPMNFSVVIEDEADPSKFKYEWKISAGTISSGLGTPSITINTENLPHETEIKASVEIKGLRLNCSNAASETGEVYIIVDIFPLVDDFGKIPRNEVRARTDAFFIALNNSPIAQAYIVNYGTNKEIVAREKLIRNHIAFRKYDAARIKFVRKDAHPRGITGIRTEFYMLPPGEELSSFL